ncbi:NYN domain-containing protein [Egbenema bharatensis]|uniref:NYN domain-containing protein n=1 Tax=Egbenema bharatensis TaxID=3463334 RepID=UPI003A842A0E
MIDALSKLEDLTVQNHAELSLLKEQVNQIANPSKSVSLSPEINQRLIRMENTLEQLSVQWGDELIGLKEQIGHIKPGRVTAKTAAIFYDLENLLRGYSRLSGTANRISIKDILKAIQELKTVEKIAVQKAYANWSMPGLRSIRREINELGIEPVQVLGFSHEPTKNAADFQLVIDAINLSNTRPSIEVFVIVSGDGGFMSLVSPLRERGKTVIGCAYQSSASRYFQSACDHFIALPDPLETEGEEPALPIATQSTPPLMTPSAPDTLYQLDPRNVRLAQKIKRRVPASPKEAVSFTQDVLRWYSTDQECRSALIETGLFLSFIKQGIGYTIPKLKKTLHLGFPKFSEYMQYVCKDTEFCLARLSASNSNIAVFLRTSISTEAEILPDLEKREIHSVETYLSILGAGKPIYQFPSPTELYTISAWLIAHPNRQTDLETLAQRIVSGLNGEISLEVVKQTVRSLISAEMFIQDPEGVPILEQKLSLKEEIVSLETVIDILRDTAAQKLSDAFSDFNEDVMYDEEILQQILPDAV